MRFKPNPSNTSAEPVLPDAERLPCLATLIPAAAVTKATAVEILNVDAPSPPVPQVSTKGEVPTTRSRKVALTD